MKNLKYYVQTGIGLALAFAVMVSRGLFSKPSLADKLMAVGDGFTVAAVLYIGMGALIWISSTGFFDIFSYAVKKAAHAIVPGMVQDDAGRYYEYKVEKEAKRTNGILEYFTLKLGIIFLIISAFLLFAWYQVI